MICEVERDTMLTATVPGGTPVMEKISTLLAFDPEPVLTMNSVVVELKECAGCTENRVLFGPNEARSIFAAPATISLLLRTQNCAPASLPVFEHDVKSFALATNLSSLIPMIG